MKKDILTVPNPKLRQKTQKVHIIDDSVRRVIQKMVAASLDWEKSHPHEVSAAMAAPQIGEPYKIVIIRDDLEDKNNQGFTALINPEIVKKEGQIVKDYEGCLSVPRIYGMVPRNSKVRLKAQLENGQEIRLKVADSLARTLQHEIDHIHGILFIDHIKGNEDAFFELDKNGDLQPLDYAQDIKYNKDLWPDEE
ncbi:peptide deformylase [Candidatus Saccharibacteria bacterium]|nr:peptide deformylase [Candidatus Saccharibacteria bacterium]